MALSWLRGAQPLQFVEGFGESTDGAGGREMLPGDELAGAAHRLELIEMRHHDLREPRDVVFARPVIAVAGMFQFLHLRQQLRHRRQSARRRHVSHPAFA